tara:strand:+ start:2721 stop:4124 length:1404 start_codon:yes stop_codon:yes gene_type:complete
MAITRAQIPEQVDIFQEGGAAETGDAFDSLAAELDRTKFDTSFQKYLQRMDKLVPQQPKQSIYDLASALGRGLLQTPNVGAGSALRGLGVGFDSLTQKIAADKAMYEQQRLQNQQAAMELALQDERAASDFLNEIAIKRIENANKKVDYITLEYDEGGVKKSVRLADTNQNAGQINDLIQNKGAREVRPASTQINLPGGNTKADDKAFDQILKDQESFGEKAEASIATLDQVSQAKALAQEVGRANFGPFSRATLQMREFVDGIGFGNLLENPEVIAPQKALNQLSMSFTMGIVSQTKGAISDREMKLFIQASPTLGSTYDGYMKQLELLERLARRDRDFYEDYLNEYTRLIDEDMRPQKVQAKLELYRTNWAENNPLFSKEETEYLENVVKSGDGLAEDFDRDAFEKKINDFRAEQAKPRTQKVVSGVTGVPDGSTLLIKTDTEEFYLKPGGNVKNKEDIIKITVQ